MSQVPEPGWYQNPENPAQIRWWDGQQWSDRTEPHPQGGAFPPPSGPQPAGAPNHPGFIGPRSTSEWVGDVVTVIRERAGHLFTLAVLLGLIPALIQSTLMYVVLKDMFLEYAEDGTSATLEGVTGGSVAALIAVIFLGWLVSLVMWVGFARQTQLCRVGRPENWSASLRAALPRLPRVFGVQLLTLLIFLGAFIVIAIVAGVLMIFIPALGILVALAALVVVLIHISMITPASALAPKGVGSVSHGFGLARGNGKYLLKRAMAFVAMAFGVVLVFFLLSYTLARPAAIEATPTRDGFVTMTGEMLVGTSLVNHVLSQTITWFGQALTSALLISGLVIAYGDLGGRFESELEPKVDSQI